MKIGELQKLLMIGTAAMIDLLQLLLFWTAIGQHIIGFIAIILFSIWFLISGADVFTHPRRALRFFGSGLLEAAVPIANLFPIFTIGIFLTIRDINRKFKSREAGDRQASA